MTTPKPDLAAAARQLNALVERMQTYAAQFIEPMSEREREKSALQRVHEFSNQLLALLDGPEQRAAQGALKAALAEAEAKPELRVRVTGLAPQDSHLSDCDFVRYGACNCGLVTR